MQILLNNILDQSILTKSYMEWRCLSSNFTNADMAYKKWLLIRLRMLRRGPEQPKLTKGSRISTLLNNMDAFTSPYVRKAIQNQTEMYDYETILNTVVRCEADTASICEQIGKKALRLQ